MHLQAVGFRQSVGFSIYKYRLQFLLGLGLTGSYSSLIQCWVTFLFLVQFRGKPSSYRPHEMWVQRRADLSPTTLA